MEPNGVKDDIRKSNYKILPCKCWPQQGYFFLHAEFLNKSNLNFFFLFTKAFFANMIQKNCKIKIKAKFLKKVSPEVDSI